MDRTLKCGCVTCICADDERCPGCGAKSCFNSDDDCEVKSGRLAEAYAQFRLAALTVVNRVLVCVNCPSVNPKVAYAVIDGEEVELCRECRARLTCRTVVVLPARKDE